MVVLMGKSSINGPFSMAMLNNQMVKLKTVTITRYRISFPLKVRAASGVSFLLRKSARCIACEGIKWS